MAGRSCYIYTIKDTFLLLIRTFNAKIFFNQSLTIEILLYHEKNLSYETSAGFLYGGF
jgi:hypothetical protein